MNNNEILIAVGTWLYDDEIESTAHIVQRDIAYGSGDIDDPAEIREDREGIFYYLKQSSLIKPDDYSSESGAFESIELLKEYAQTVCKNIVWK